MDIIIEDLKDNECQLCGRYCRIRKMFRSVVVNNNITFYNSLEDEDLKEMEIITHCAKCRNLLIQQKKTKKELNRIQNEIDYLKFIK